MPHDSATGCDLLVWAEMPSARVPMETGRHPGQVIDIRQCPHSGWGKQECPTAKYRYKVVYVPDKSKEELLYLTDQYHEEHANTPEETALGFPPQQKAFCRRKVHIDLDMLDVDDKDAILNNDDRYHTMPWARLAGRFVDDSNHPVLRKEYEKKDQTPAMKEMLASIRLGLDKAPGNWNANKHLFDGWDTSAEESALSSRIQGEIDRGERARPAGWSDAMGRVMP